MGLKRVGHNRASAGQDEVVPPIRNLHDGVVEESNLFPPGFEPGTFRV